MLQLLPLLLLTQARSLDGASQALDDLKYAQCLAVLPAESDAKGWTEAQVQTLLATRALCHLGLKHEAEAVDAFRRLFALAPAWVLPDHYGPRVQTVAARVRAEALKAGTLNLRFEGGRLHAGTNAYGYAKELQLWWREPGGSWSSTTLDFAPVQDVPWPAGTLLEVWGRIRGLNGSVLASWGSETAPVRIEPGPVVKVEGPREAVAGRGLGGLGLAGLGAGALALVAGGVGTGFAVSSQVAQQAQASATRDAEGRITSLTQREAFALDAQAKDAAGVATACFLGAAGLAAAGVGLLVADRVTAAPAPGGVTLVVPLDATFGVAEVRR